jgi:hypothetical protein
VGGSEFRHNFDGVVLSDQSGYPYIQVFRDGIIELTMRTVFWYRNESTANPVLSPTSLEKAVVAVVGQALALQEQMGASKPTWMLLTMVNVQGVPLADKPQQLMLESGNSKRIDRNELLFPESLIDRDDLDLPTIFRPLFDQVWNSGGYSHSRSYDADGNWDPK